MEIATDTSNVQKGRFIEKGEAGRQSRLVVIKSKSR